VTMAMKSGVIGIFIFSLCSTVVKNDLHGAPFSVLPFVSAIL